MVSMFRSTINFLTRVVPTRVILRSVIAFAFIFAVISFVEPLKTYSQEIVDKTVASISDGISTEMISLSDIRWQLALQPEFPLDPARKQDLDGALQTLINNGGKIVFNGGAAPVTLTLSATLMVDARKEVIIDGRNLLTISGNNAVRIFDKGAPANQGEGTLFAVRT